MCLKRARSTPSLPSPALSTADPPLYPANLPLPQGALASRDLLTFSAPLLARLKIIPTPLISFVPKVPEGRSSEGAKSPEPALSEAEGAGVWGCPP